MFVVHGPLITSPLPAVSIKAEPSTSASDRPRKEEKSRPQPVREPVPSTSGVKRQHDTSGPAKDAKRPRTTHSSSASSVQLPRPVSAIKVPSTAASSKGKALAPKTSRVPVSVAHHRLTALSAVAALLSSAPPAVASQSSSVAVHAPTTTAGQLAGQPAGQPAGPIVGPAAGQVVGPIPTTQPASTPASTSTSTTTSANQSTSGVTVRAPPSSIGFGNSIRLSHTALHTLTRAHPLDSPDVIADRLAARYGWTILERNRHRDRLYDIRRTTALDTLADQSLIPPSRASARMDAFVEVLRERLEDARRILDEFDDH